jgi:hypothetical protein
MRILLSLAISAVIMTAADGWRLLAVVVAAPDQLIRILETLR